MTAVVQYDGVPMGYMVDWEDQSIEERLRAHRAQERRRPGLGRSVRPPRATRLKWGEVDPIVRSEVLADVATIVEKAR